MTAAPVASASAVEEAPAAVEAAVVSTAVMAVMSVRQVADAVGGPPVCRGKPTPVDAAAPQRPDAAGEHHHHASHSEGGWDSPVYAGDEQAGAGGIVSVGRI
ncbi:MAG TPA: hypothetical protein VKB03_03140 [Conexibacter sp.]|nr:hypothetical protein [Conexibacter sp.]